MVTKTRRKKRVSRGPDVAPGYDREPVHPGEVGNVEITDALNWYNYFWEEKKSIKALVDHFRQKGDKETSRVVKNVDAKLVHPTFCHLARMMDNGSILPDRTMERFNQHIDFLVEKYNKAKEKEAQEEEKPQKIKPTVQDRVQEQADAVSSDIDFVIDRFIEEGYKDQKFDCYQWLDRQGIKPVHARKIADAHRPMLEELKSALDDDGVREYYAKMKKADLKRLVKMVESVVSDCDTWADNKTKARVPKKRKPKTKTIEDQVKKLQYKEEDKELKIASVPPEKIPASQQVWLYNVKQKKLTRLDARNRDGFTVSGTTIKGFDSDVSTAKSVRKPQETLEKVVNGGKRVLKKLMDELTTKDQEAKGRVNKDTIIVRVEI